MGRFKRWNKDENGNVISMNLKPIEWDVYRYLEVEYKMDAKRWISKPEIVNRYPVLAKGETSHDYCAELNNIRLWLLEAKKRKMISHLVLIKNNNFKLASNEDEVLKEAEKEWNIGIKRLVRASILKGSLKIDGQGRMIDRNGNIIDEKSLASRFESLF